ncbi:MarR family winged helix-turn-helix transcriptional regulator [Campylobacter lari]|uniref:MarR family winged helix-turn-helix transcriptional regulator n=1 Tax=Campylobacter lari TaxID=201 RepID=UPI0011EA8AE6|nr:winged helix-turn-helix transcriptional regulator [Campylobacter lari]KAB0591169.1 winged helix-turn-helix transcriptional regulator [Campylobacter lari subsp. concheus]EAL0060279.1 winged helix-turn-helix transcriptional regulator [Campylobacter lari]ECL4969935.1 winged helix-turn-helix transcriptional regulator [Campylobacter lari]EHL5010478.1 winged helix-turn-helix transcriptional regulator [Campylobacter lari]
MFYKGFLILFQKITYTNRKILYQVNEILKPFGLKSSDWRVFVYLNQHGYSTLAPICEFYQMDKAMLSRVVSKLAKLEYIEFLEADDKREKIITLSAKGKEIFLDANAYIRKYERNILDILDVKDQERLLKLLDYINEKI